MTFEGKCIKNEGHNRYCCVPREIFMPMVMIPYQYKKMIVHIKKLCQEWTNNFLCWCIAICRNFILFWVKIVKFLWTLFLNSKCIYPWHKFESWDNICVAYIYCNFLKLNDSKLIINNHGIYLILLPYWYDLKIIINNFSFKYNKIWAPRNLFRRWYNETTIGSMKPRVNQVQALCAMHCNGPLSSGHWAINITSKHFIHADLTKCPKFPSIYAMH